jgi:hypothetical protein
VKTQYTTDGTGLGSESKEPLVIMGVQALVMEISELARLAESQRQVGLPGSISSQRELRRAAV